MTTQIALSGPGAVGMCALVDDEDAESVLTYAWYPLRKPYATYARTLVAGNRSVYLHRFIMGVERGDRRQVDHINHDGLDNTRGNLRVVNQHRNMANRKGAQARSITGVLGVSPHSRNPGVLVRCTVDGEPHYLGVYATAVEGALARNAFIAERGLLHTLSDLDAAGRYDALLSGEAAA